MKNLDLDIQEKQGDGGMLPGLFAAALLVAALVGGMFYWNSKPKQPVLDANMLRAMEIPGMRVISPKLDLVRAFFDEKTKGTDKPPVANLCGPAFAYRRGGKTAIWMVQRTTEKCGDVEYGEFIGATGGGNDWEFTSDKAVFFKPDEAEGFFTWIIDETAKTDFKAGVKGNSLKPITADDLGTVITTNPPQYEPSKNEQRRQGGAGGAGGGPNGGAGGAGGQ